ncbi:XPB/Ssl2-like helicase family protein [Streptomyces sp. SLBN-118]|uniref:helicase C-terminal domain-containing protein n=1 Tax=Streptomyces sp. SLBN-118 TaxID=2768454 RepID=UPI001153F5B3|nr:helicase C-terminal domain-containing protein [Streptomyces sp. SLBN-118]TQK44352.1 XPB/Ssl2-like helicase family protein [Streptomyces sp. SLBN-118]
MKSGKSTLTAWLHRLDTEHLEQVLAARPDAVSPSAPRSVSELAERLQRPGSVALALPRLPLPALQAAEALAALSAPASRDVLADLLDATEDEAARGLTTALQTLAMHALVWPDSEGTLRMAAPLRQAWDTPLGLDRPLATLLMDTTSEELRRMLTALGVRPPGTKPQRLATLVEHHSDPARVAAVVAQAPADARKLLDRRAEPAYRPQAFVVIGSQSAPEPGARWALERGLLVQGRYSYGPVRMPAEVALALRGPGWHAPFDPAPPVTLLVPVTPAEVDSEASAAATAFAAHAASVLSVCATAPPARLKSGGVGARELARIGRAARCEETVVRLTLEMAYEAGLMARDRDRVATTDAYDTWAESEPAERLPVLLHAWWTLGLTPSQARDDDNKALPALAGAPPCVGCLQARMGLLTAASCLPAGQGAKNSAELGPLTHWSRPLAEVLPQDATPFATVIREAELLGVLTRGALSPIGAALLADSTEGLATACRRLLPAATATARFGSDLTAVVIGTPAARLVVLLDSVADRETSGTASAWRFSPASVRRALDAGRSPDSIEADLAAVATTPLPQPLSYLITDTARGHGRIRIASAACVIHSEEPALLTEIAAHRKLSELGLRPLAPTVLVSRTPLDKTLAALRTEGYAPVAETADGTVRVERPRSHRATAPVPPPRRAVRSSTPSRTTTTPKQGELTTLAARLAGASLAHPALDPYNGVSFATDTEKIIAGHTMQISHADVRQLAHAVDSGTAVTIEYVATTGSRTIRTVSGLDLDPPYLYAWCHLRDAERVFTLSRIHGVMPPA